MNDDWRGKRFVVKFSFFDGLSYSTRFESLKNEKPSTLGRSALEKFRNKSFRVGMVKNTCHRHWCEHFANTKHRTVGYADKLSRDGKLWGFFGVFSDQSMISISRFASMLHVSQWTKIRQFIQKLHKDEAQQWETLHSKHENLQNALLQRFSLATRCSNYTSAS
jgi:hypothetical protein